MPGPWDKYKESATAPGPWDKYTQQQSPDFSNMDTMPAHRPGQTLPITKGQKVKDYLVGPTEPAISVKDFALRVAPESVRKLIPRVAYSAYEAVKGQTDPIVESLSTLQPTGLRRKMEGNAANTLSGLAQGMTAPTGLMGYDAFKQAWASDPAGSALAVAPTLKMLGKVPKAVKDAIPADAPTRLARSALKPYIGESKARQVQTTKALDTFLTDKNQSARASKFFKNNLKEMEEIVGRQNVYLDEKGQTRANIKPIEDNLTTFINEARETPGVADSAVQAAEKVLTDIQKHPDYNPADTSLSTSTLQKMKTNTWNHLRKKNAFNSDANPALNDAMWEAASGMNEIISSVIPEMAAENSRYGELANVNKILKRSIDRHANNNIIPLRALIQMVKGDVAGFSQAATMWAFDHPTFKSYIAQKLAKTQGKPVKPSTVNQTIDRIKKAAAMRNKEQQP